MSLDKQIKQTLKRSRNRVYNSQLVDGEGMIFSGHDISRSIIYQLKNEYKRQEEPVLNVSDIEERYNILVNDESIQNPFIISSGLVGIIRKHTKNYQGKEEKARAIYLWIEKNIEYGTSKRKNGYKNSKETLIDREGVCGEMAFVYIAMVRCCNLRSAYVSVDIDYEGKKVNHGCAVVDVGYRDVLVDPAYHSFDIQHLNYRILSDKQVLERFNQWRRG